MNIKKIIFVGIAGIAFLWCLVRYISHSSPPVKNNIFVVGTAAGYAPFVSINAEGEYEGFDIDFAHALAKEMGKVLVIKDYGSMSSLFIALKKNTIDAIIWGLSITPERTKHIAMVHYQGSKTTSYPLLFTQSSVLKKMVSEKNFDMDDLAGLTLCVEPGSSQESFLDTYDFVVKKTVEKIDDALFNIQYGKADGALVDASIARKFQDKYPELQVINIPIDEKNQVNGHGVAISYENNQLIGEVEKAIVILKNNKTIEQLEKKWNIDE